MCSVKYGDLNRFGLQSGSDFRLVKAREAISEARCNLARCQ
jgi:hypothetical protein